MRRAGLDVEVTQFDMPDWKENAPPVFQQLSPDGEDLHAGHRGRRRQRGGRLHHVQVLAHGGRSPSAPVVPTNDIVDPEPGADTQHERLRGRGLPGRDERRDLADPARHLRHRQKLANAQAAGAVGVIMFNEGDSAGRMNAGFRAGPTDLGDPRGVLELRRRQGALRRVHGRREPDRAPGDQRREHPPLLPAGDRRDPQGRPEPRRARRRAPRLGAGRAGHQRRRLGHRVAARAGRADLRSSHAKPKHKIRFLWFGGEEDGLVGSQYYAEHLTQTPRSRRST